MTMTTVKEQGSSLGEYGGDHDGWRECPTAMGSGSTNLRDGRWWNATPISNINQEPFFFTTA